MSTFNVGDKVRVVKSPTPALPLGSEGTVIGKPMEDCLWVEVEGNKRPRGVFGNGWALTADEVEHVEAA